MSLIKLSEVVENSSNSVTLSVGKVNDPSLPAGQIAVNVTATVNTHSPNRNPSQTSSSMTYTFKGTPESVILEAEEVTGITGILG